MSIKTATVFVCTMCDRDPLLLDSQQAEGLAYLARVKKLLRGRKELKICGVKCLGGCETNGTPNGCCSIGLTAPGRHSYVLNKFQPESDDWKVLEFLKLYFALPHGRMKCSAHTRGEELRPHVCTRVPSAKI